jgi:hypothetical protein
VEDHSAQKRHLQQIAREQATARRAAADELRSAGGRFADVRLTSAALGLLLELLATALGNSRLRRVGAGSTEEAEGFELEAAESEDVDLRIRLTVRHAAGVRTVLHSTDGDLVLDDLELEIGSSSVPSEGEAQVSVS